MIKENCPHKNKKDLTQGLGAIRNHYCPDCKMHWYRGRSWTEAEWNEYVEDFSEDKSKYFPSTINKIFSKFIPIKT